MSRKMIGLILLLIAGELLGYIAGSYAYRLFDKTVPPAVITSFVRSGAHGAYIVFGVVLGVVIAAWSVLVALCSGFFMGGAKNQV